MTVLHHFTLLIVEDNQQTLAMLRRLLQDNVKDIYSARDGEEGLATYREKHPDLVLTDINMPILDGLAMSRAIKEDNPECPIILASAFDDRDTLLTAIDIGIDGFIVKPIDIKSLHSKLKRQAQNLQNRLDAQRIKAKEQAQKEEQLYHLAHNDTLTGIPNRFQFNQKLQQVLQRAREDGTCSALFFIDLDNFKAVNDRYGHAAGDAVLVAMVRHIQSTIRTSDFLARIGGDEFALIIEKISDRAYLSLLADKIIRAASQPITLANGDSWQASCSIGISLAQSEEPIREKDLIHQADLAMYQAKQNGKSHFLFYDSKKADRHD